MNQSETAGWRIHVGPIRDAGYHGACCSRQSDADGSIRSRGELMSANHQIQEVEDHRGGPCPDGQVCQHDVQRLAQPGTVQEVSELLCLGTSIGVQSFIKDLLESAGPLYAGLGAS